MTAESSRLQIEYREKGQQDRLAGKPRNSFTLDGLLKKWWLEGWDSGDKK